MRFKSVSRLTTRVERALAAALLLSLPAIPANSAERADVFERREPDPWPQELSDRADYPEAKQLLNKHKWEEATIVLRSILRKNPDFLPGAVDLSRALVYSRRREEALGVISQAMSRQKSKRIREALASRARVISRLFVTHKTQQIYQEGLNLLQTQKYRPARERFERALEQEPDNVEILTRIGQCLVLEGDFDSAAERLRLAKRLNPHEPEISLWLGRALHKRGELNEGLRELITAYEGLEASERAPIWLADAYRSTGDRRSAVQMLEEDIKNQPFHLSSIIALARLRAELFREGTDTLWSARKDLQIALSRLPKYSEPDSLRFEGELGVDFRQTPSELKEEITLLLGVLESRLQQGPPPKVRSGARR